MTLQEAIALYSGLTYIAAAAVCVPIIKVLGPLYPSRITAPLPFIICGATYMGVLFFRGVTILFPGQVVTLSAISWVSPLKATADLMLMLFILDYVLRRRAPPPLITRLIEIGQKFGMSERGVVQMAFESPSLAMADTPASEDLDHPQIGPRWVRVLMLVGAGAVLASFVLFLTLNSGANAP
ncbi:hypothetical protein [uncultured Brevundimonas sp.]|uniref:hypothetical protein n=1 Tax=uncultured Brevundimonas sp. TaxID=213418 RepID=UPI0025E8028B|nr:hypothetical protein [uncultured Brevundimonas sp.]